MFARLIFFAAFAATLVSTPVGAQTSTLWGTCTGRPGVSWEQQIKSCTAIIESNQAAPARRAVAYNNRGVAQLELNPGGTVLPDNRAMADFGEAIKLNPKYVDAYYNRGRLWHVNGVFHNAIDLYSYAIKLNPKYAAAYRQRGVAWVMRGDAARARADLTEAIRLNPREAGSYLERSYVLRAAHDIDGALADLTKAIRIDPKLAVAYGGRGSILIDKEKFHRAVADYGAAIRLDPSNADHHVNRGYTHFFLGDFSAAAADLHRASNLNSNHHQRADIALFRYLARARAGQDARAELESAQTYHATSVFGLYLGDAAPEDTLKIGLSTRDLCEAEFYVGQWHLIRGEREEALRHLRLAAANPCTEVFPHHRAAVSELKRMGEALVATPASAEVSRLWRTCTERPGEDREQHIQSCTAIIESKLEAPANLAIAYNNRGNAWRENREFDRAIADFTQTIRLNPKFVSAYDELGRLLVDKGEFDRALAMYSEAIAKDPADNLIGDRGLVHFHRISSRGHVHFLRGDFSAAAADLDRAIEIFPVHTLNAVYAPLRYLARVRAGQDGTAELAAQMERWMRFPPVRPLPVFELYLGRSSPEAALKAAGDYARDRCQTEFFVGQWQLIRGNRDEARQRLQAAANEMCRGVDLTYTAAVCELKRMEP